MPSLRFSRPALLALIVGTAFGAGFSIRAHGQESASFDLFTYRVALEQLGAGHAQNAQLLLESSHKNTPLAPENALLLAYLEEVNGHREDARATLGSIETPSPLMSAYLRRLGDVAPQNLAFPGSQAVSGARNNARLVIGDERLAKLEAFMVDIVNDDREKRGLSRLQNDPQLAEVARAHSAEMRDKKYFAHESPTPSLYKPLDRYVAGIGTTPRVVAENIYHISGLRSFPTQIDTRDGELAFMNSPGHRANILSRDVTRIGIGFGMNESGDLWVTQMFSQKF